MIKSMLESSSTSQELNKMNQDKTVDAKNNGKKRKHKNPPCTTSQTPPENEPCNDVHVPTCISASGQPSNAPQANPDTCEVHTPNMINNPFQHYNGFYHCTTTDGKERIMSTYATPKRTARDHSYASSDNTILSSSVSQDKGGHALCMEQGEVNNYFSDIEPLSSSDESELLHVAPTEDSSLDQEENDTEYKLPTSSDASDTESESESIICNNTPTTHDYYVDQPKYMVFESNLEELLKFCKNCGSPVIKLEKMKRDEGSMIAYKIWCHQGCEYKWQSQPYLDETSRQPVGNILLSAAILMTGNTYGRVASVAKAANMRFISETTYLSHQKQNLIPVIQDTWKKQKAEVIAEIKKKGPLTLVGDSRCDSPGHNAKFGSYTLMEGDNDNGSGTKKIVSMELVQVSEVKNANHMEPEGLRRCLADVKRHKLTLSVLATDRHLMVGAMMRKDYANIDHQFDIWHFSKGITKQLTKKANMKNNADLAPWIQSIANHLWWCAATCKGSSQLLKEKWISVLSHVTNKHSWTGNNVFHRCDHKKLTSKQKKKTCWLDPKSDTFKALQSIVMNTRVLNALPHLTKFCHTGELEVFHSMLLKYCSKRQHFHYDAMKARLMLATMDWNSQTREELLDDNGHVKDSQVWSKRRKQWVRRTRYAKTSMNYVPVLTRRVIEAMMQNENLPPMEQPIDLPKYVAKIAKPQLKDMNEKRSRFATT